MNQSQVGAALVGLACAVLSACGPKPGAAPGPLSMTVAEGARARWADVTPESLEHGRQLFLGNCHQCHAYPDRAAYTAEQWPSLVQRMAHKAHLSDADAELILRFVLTDRGEAAQPARP